MAGPYLALYQCESHRPKLGNRVVKRSEKSCQSVAEGVAVCCPACGYARHRVRENLRNIAKPWRNIIIMYADACLTRRHLVMLGNNFLR